MVPLLGRLKRLASSDEKSQAKAFSSWLSFGFGISTQTLVDNEEATRAVSRTLSKGNGSASTSPPDTADVPAKPKGTAPLGGIRPVGSAAPRNAVLAGTYNAKPYGS